MTLVRRITSGEGEIWREAVNIVIASRERGNELISLADAEAALSDARCYAFVAESDSGPIGLLSAYRFPDLQAGGPIVYLYDIEVVASARRKGIGRQMLQALLACCDQDDVHTVWAGTDVTNEAARALFVRTGASLEGTTYAEYEWDLD